MPVQTNIVLEFMRTEEKIALIAFASIVFGILTTWREHVESFLGRSLITASAVGILAVAIVVILRKSKKDES